MINKNPKLIKYKNFKDSRGLLVPFEIKNKMIKVNNSFHFKMKRIFFSAGRKNYYRGDHAHKKLKEFIWCLAGKIQVFNISLLGKKSSFILDKPDKGLYIPEKTWTYQVNLSENSIYCVIASDIYIEEDYIRKFEEFEELIATY